MSTEWINSTVKMLRLQAEKHQCLIVMDWAIKWFGKKGISWHVSACITRTENTDMEFEVTGIFQKGFSQERSGTMHISSSCQVPL